MKGLEGLEGPQGQREHRGPCIIRAVGGADPWRERPLRELRSPPLQAWLGWQVRGSCAGQAWCTGAGGAGGTPLAHPSLGQPASVANH